MPDLIRIGNSFNKFKMFNIMVKCSPLTPECMPLGTTWEVTELPYLIVLIAVCFKIYKVCCNGVEEIIAHLMVRAVNH